MRRPGLVVERPARRLHHHQGMIGDHEIGPPRPAHTALDIAFLVMLAGGVDAFPVMITEIESPACAEQIDEPGRKITAGQITVPRPRRPARHQAKRNGVVSVRADPTQSLLHIQQAEVVLPPLANDDATRLQRRVRI